MPMCRRFVTEYTCKSETVIVRHCQFQILNYLVAEIFVLLQGPRPAPLLGWSSVLTHDDDITE